MTVAEQLINDLTYWKEQKAMAIQKLEDIEESLVGMELIYQGNYASILQLYGNMQNACLYVEDEDGDSWEVGLSLEELLELIR